MRCLSTQLKNERPCSERTMNGPVGTSSLLERVAGLEDAVYTLASEQAVCGAVTSMSDSATTACDAGAFCLN